MNVLTALAAADPVRDQVISYDARLLAEIVATPRVATRRRRRRKVVVAAWLSAILVPIAGVGAAGAAGIIPDGAKEAFPWIGHPGSGPVPDLTTAVRVFVEPGPAGTEFEVWHARASEGYECLAVLFRPTSAPANVPAHALSTGGGDSCSSADAQRSDGFARDGGGSGGTDQPTTFALTAGAAVRATLTLDGVVSPVAIQNGYVAGWIPAGVKTAGATLTGFGADGSVLGTHDVSLDPPP